MSTMSTATQVKGQAAGWVREQIAYVFGMYAYAYGFPLVMMDVTRRVMTAAPGSGEYSAPVNSSIACGSSSTPISRTWSASAATLCGLPRSLDLDAEPAVFSHPATQERYLVAQVMDMWTDNFASIGTRTTGKEAGDCLIAGPGWHGTPRRHTAATRDTPGCWSRSPPPTHGTSPRYTRSRTG